MDNRASVLWQGYAEHRHVQTLQLPVPGPPHFESQSLFRVHSAGPGQSLACSGAPVTDVGFRPQYPGAG
jgi:hypothetical protein